MTVAATTPAPRLDRYTDGGHDTGAFVSIGPPL
jgi:hypothetical protein